jgi:hypothetical protein
VGEGEERTKQKVEGRYGGVPLPVAELDGLLVVLAAVALLCFVVAPLPPRICRCRC